VFDGFPPIDTVRVIEQEHFTIYPLAAQYVMELDRVTITYDATVTQLTSGSITTSAIIDAGSAGQLTTSVTVIVNGESLFLPLLRR
jgi:hypothetical protein